MNQLTTPIIFILKTNKIIEPFISPIQQIKIGHRSLQEIQESTLKSLGFKFQYINDQNQISSASQSCLVIHDNVLFSKRLILSFLKKARKNNAVSQCYTIKSIFSWCYSDNDSQNFNPVGIYYVPMGMSIHDGLGRVEIIPEVPVSDPLMLPIPIFNKKDVRLNLPLDYAIDIDLWPDVLLANSLICRQLCLDGLKYFSWIVKRSPFFQEIVLSPRVAGMINKVGRHSKIHPTASLEGCVIGDKVRIGAYCRLRASCIGNNVSIADGTSINLSSIGDNSYISRTRMYNCSIGQGSMLMIENINCCIVGNGSFVPATSTMLDLNLTRTNISILVDGKRIETPYFLLGCCIGDDVMIGTNLTFGSGLIIPHGSYFVSGSLVNKIPMSENGFYVQKSEGLAKLPKSLLRFNSETTKL